MNSEWRKRFGDLRELLVLMQEEALELREAVDALHEEETEAQDAIPEAFVDQYEKAVAARSGIEEMQGFFDEADAALSAAIEQAEMLETNTLPYWPVRTHT